MREELSAPLLQRILLCWLAEAPFCTQLLFRLKRLEAKLEQIGVRTTEALAQALATMPPITTLSQALDISEDSRVITLADPPHAILHTNRAWSNLTGFKFTEVANRSNHFLQGPHTERDPLEQLRDAVRAGEHTKVRIVNYTKGGDPFFNTLECFPLSDRQGNVTHYCGVLAGEPCSDPTIPKIDQIGRASCRERV